MADLYAIAQSWLGTPFQHQGRLKGIGVDCIGLGIEVYREGMILQKLGLPQTWNFTAYKRDGAGSAMQRSLGQYLRRVLPPYPQAALALFLCAGTEPTHVGLLFPQGRDISLIHSVDSSHDTRQRDSTRRKVQEHALRGLWLRRMRAVYAPPNTEGACYVG